MFGFASSRGGNNVFTIEVPGRTGLLGMSACPGVRLDTLRRNPVRNVKKDIAAYQEWGANGVVTLVEEQELIEYGVPNLGELVQEAGMWWRHMPIVDFDVPAKEFEDSWSIESHQIRSALAVGERIVIHCLAGLGRTGMMAARLLVEFGMTPQEAIVHVRRVRPRAIQTPAQEEYVRASGRKGKVSRWSNLPPGVAAAGDLDGDKQAKG